MKFFNYALVNIYFYISLTLFITYLFSFFPLLLILNCFFIFVFKRWLGPVGTFYSSIFILILAISIAFIELISILFNGSYFFIDFGRWFFCIDLIDSHLVFCLDSLSLLLSILVMVLTSLALFFGSEYMYRESFINRLLYLLNMFATSVILLFVVYDFFLILVVWELIGLFSFLLVNFYSNRIYTIKAALKTFVFSRISDMFIFMAFTLIILVYNTTDLSLIFLQTPFLIFHRIYIGFFSLHFLTLLTFFLSLSGVIKGAQFFFHVWLPDAMEAPTPASALIHSSTLVIMGVYLIIRCSVLFEFVIFTNYFLAFLGGLTIAFGAVSATFQNDIKKLVAYSTISQIGYLVCGCGFCCYEEVILYLIMHAVNKAFLFILVGYLVHYFNGNTDLRFMGGIYLYSFELVVLMFGVCLNLVGLPLTAGFFSKEFLLFQTLKDDFFSLIIRSFWIISFFFTPIYMFMLIHNVAFNIKKSNLNIYKSNWFVKFNDFFFLVDSSSYNQFSIITSRLTSFILFSFWFFFFFFGEHVVLIFFNYSNLLDTVSQSEFFFLKNFYIFNLNSFSDWINYYLFFIVVFLATSSLVYLFTIKNSFLYNNFYLEFVVDFFLFIIFFLLLVFYFLLF